jgi:thiol-disulfide isomerase/thioredoxin
MKKIKIRRNAMRINLTVIVAVIFIATFSTLSAAPLKIGDPAPELHVSTWVKNGPVKLSDGVGKNVYLVEFWATWCPPCRMSIPHLDKLQKKYASKGLVVVGISKEPLETVKPFVMSQKKMNYNVGVDDKGLTYAEYMEGLAGIPAAFLIGKSGKVLWKGHPLESASVVEQVISGDFDIEASKLITDLSAKLQQALQTQKFQDANTIAHQILDINPGNQMAMRVALYGFQNDNKKALDFLSKLIDKHPGSAPPYLQKLQLLNAMKNESELRMLIERYFESFKDDPAKLNSMAWIILDQVSFGLQPLDLALKIAKKAVELSAKNDDEILLAAHIDTLARCYYAIGRLDLAIKSQKRALKLVEDTREKAQFAKTLGFYQKILKLGRKEQ